MPRVPPVTSATRAMISSLRHHRRQTASVGGRKPPLSVLHHPTSVLLCPISIFPRTSRCPCRRRCTRWRGLFGVPLLHLVEQSHQHAGTRRADRMSDRDSAAVDIHLVGIP